MKISQRVFLALAIAVPITSFVTGCASRDARSSFAEPDDAHPIVMDMKAMAALVRVILDTDEDTGLSDEQRRSRTLDALDGIEAIAARIDPDQMPLPWSVSDRYIGAFLYDVGLARTFASVEPANLVPATRLANSCLACHRSL